MIYPRLLALLSSAAFLAACGGGGSDSTTPITPTTNTAPVASAGTDQSVVTNAVVTLDGSKSTDVNSDPLTYAWTLTSKPAGSSATLLNPTSAKPTFTADSAGSYVATLIVNDGKIDSYAETVSIAASVDNAAPIANAGITQSVITGSVVTLDGSASTDANSDPLTYAWTLTTMPVGSAASLSSPTSAKPTFTADVSGTYTASLIVNDGKVISSKAATVSITAAAANVAPVANAGTAQNVVAGATVTLDGSASSDANGDALTYTWTLTSKPAGSAATLSSASTAKPTFKADVAGTYVASLIISDGKASSTAATVSTTAAVANVAPVANAGAAQSVAIRSIVTLDGSASTDANGDPLTYAWTLTSKPVGSTATLSSATSVKPTFSASVAGIYVATLIVSDGKIDSNVVTVSITVTAPTGYDYAQHNGNYKCRTSDYSTTVSFSFQFNSTSVVASAGGFGSETYSDKIGFIDGMPYYSNNIPLTSKAETIFFFNGNLIMATTPASDVPNFLADRPSSVLTCTKV